MGTADVIARYNSVNSDIVAFMTEWKRWTSIKLSSFLSKDTHENLAYLSPTQEILKLPRGFYSPP